MSSTTLHILPKRTYEFTSLQPGIEQTLLIAERIDVSRYVECIVELRVHDQILNGGGYILFPFYGDGFTEQDPTLVFRTAPYTAITLEDNSNAIAPYLMIGSAGTEGQYLAFGITALTGGFGVVKVTISVDLILKTGDVPNGDDG